MKSIILLIAGVFLLCGCGARLAPTAIDQRADANIRELLASERAAHAHTKAERDAALADRDAAKAEARAALIKLHDQENHTERTDDRRYGTFCAVSASVLAYLAYQVPIARLVLSLASGALAAAALAFQGAAIAVDHRWLYATTIAFLGLAYGLHKLLGFHDQIHRLAALGKVEVATVAGWGRRLWVRIAGWVRSAFGLLSRVSVTHKA